MHADPIASQSRSAIPESMLIGATAFAAMLLALADDAAPTGEPTLDAIWRMLAAALVVAAGCYGGPVVVAVAAAMAAVAVGASLLLVLPVMALVLLVVTAIRARHYAFEAASVASLLVSVAIFRLGFESPHGLATLVAFAIAGVLLGGGYVNGPDELGSVLRGGATIAVVGGLVAVVILVVVGVQARGDLLDAIDGVETSADQFRDGDEDRAEQTLAEALDSLENAADRFGTPWAQAVRIVPVLGQHVHAADTLLADGVDAGRAAERVLDRFDPDALALDGGRIDIAEVQRLAPSVTSFADAAEQVIVSLDEVDSPWLIGPIGSRIDDARGDLTSAVENARNAADAMEIAPAMLGAEGRRSYLLVFATPAEARGTVGLLGNWALVTADAGALELDRVGRIEDLNTILRTQTIDLSTPTRYVERYGDFNVDRQMQDATLSPDFPDVAEVVAQLFESAQGIEVDGVVLADPETVGAMLAFTGPVTVQGRTLNATSVVPFLLVDQYSAFFTDAERVLFLTGLLQATFDAVFEADLSDPWELRDHLGDVVREDRLAIYSAAADEQTVLGTLGVDGAFPDADGDDLVAIVTQNSGQNKIDSFMQRTLDYAVDIDPATGALGATLTVEITNNAPASGQPAAVIGNNDQGLPAGTNLQRLVVYTQHDIVDAQLDGQTVGLQQTEEFGVHAATVVLEVPAGATQELVFVVEGSVDLADGYDLVIPVQPGVADDLVEVTVTADGVPFEPTDAFDGDDGDWRITDTAFVFDRRTAADVRLPLTVGGG